MRLTVSAPAIAARFRWLTFQLHWVLGITIGIVLSIMGLTGATMAFEDPIMRALSPGVANVAPHAGPVLTPDQILARFAQQRPGAKPTLLALREKAGASPQVTFTPSRAAPGAKTEKLYLDPYDGEILGHARGETFFAVVRQIHRYMLLPGDGKGLGRQITGAAAFSLIYFALSGLYLRWPKRALDWKVWLKPNLKLKKRGLYWSLHSVAGTWVFLIYLTIALTGLTWSYDWWKQGFDRLLTGQATPAPAEPKIEKAGKAKTAIPLDPAWAALRRETQGLASAIISVPKPGADTIRVRYLTKDAAHDRAFNELRLDAKTGAVRSREIFATKSLGRRIASARLAVHRGSVFGWPGAILFMVAAAAMPLFPITGYLLYFGRRRAKATAKVRLSAAAKGAG